MVSLWDEYRAWLLRRVGYYHLVGGHNGVLPADARYSMLLHTLHNTKFSVVVERDINRIKDGMSLRDEFLDDVGVADGDFVKPCGILEMLVALAIRVNEEYIGNPDDPHPEYIFWEFLCNLGLDKYDDKHFDEGKIIEICDTFIFREYDFNGKGGILPLKRPKVDQRDAEIWSQMMAYLSENY